MKGNDQFHDPATLPSIFQHWAERCISPIAGLGEVRRVIHNVSNAGHPVNPMTSLNFQLKVVLKADYFSSGLPIHSKVKLAF
jgi:hypothetical protein